jgi:hypothetical protein
VKALASIVTAAAVLIGADVFVRSSDRTAQPAVAASVTQGKVVLHGGSGMPPPPPDAY